MKTRYILIGLLTAGSMAMAGEVIIPNTFKANTPAKAAEVNANFTAVKNAVKDNVDKIGQNAGKITQNINDIAANKAAIDVKQKQITGDCVVGSYIRRINSDGTVVCGSDKDTTYSAGAGVLIESNTIKLDERSIVIGPTAFVPYDSEKCFSRRSPNGYFFSETSSGNECHAYAPVQLPEGVRITDMVCTYIKNDGSGDLLTITLEHAGNSGSTVMTSIITSQNNSSMQEQENDSITDPVVSGQSSYFIHFNPPDNTNTSNGAKNLINSCQIIYEY